MKRILTLCGNPNRVGDACLMLADRLSEKVSSIGCVLGAPLPVVKAYAHARCDTRPSLWRRQLALPDWVAERERIMDCIRQLIAHAKANYGKSVEPSYDVLGAARSGRAQRGRS